MNEPTDATQVHEAAAAPAADDRDAATTRRRERRQLRGVEVGHPRLMKSAALELGTCNITVNALIPGLVDTPLTRYEKRLDESFGETGHKPPEHPKPSEAWAERKPTVPMQVGWLQPEDIAPAAVFPASDAAAMVTGAEYEVTGGDSAKSA